MHDWLLPIIEFIRRPMNVYGFEFSYLQVFLWTSITTIIIRFIKGIMEN